ncbi:hypothetical protein H5410_040171 [Solanum commersonii]|uniref:Uncharacterized protein n=1 Tax=Solanum commersonii TaxID=4109 RepID=A0A9J5XN52_SOLCO|nr:hypothetical protein H5410_040171 [Solanum commersonii]
MLCSRRFMREGSEKVVSYMFLRSDSKEAVTCGTQQQSNEELKTSSPTVDMTKECIDRYTLENPLIHPSGWSSGLGLRLLCWRSQVRNPLLSLARGLPSGSSSSHRACLVLVTLLCGLRAIA